MYSSNMTLPELTDDYSIFQFLSKKLNVPVCDLQMEPVHGGITNLLYKVSAAESSFLVRLHGKGGSLLIDRDRENKIVQQLSDLGFGPRVYSVFGNGRVEEFFENRRELCPSEIDEFMPAIAERLRQLHSVDLPILREETNLLIWDNLKFWLEHIKEDDSSSFQSEISECRQLFERISDLCISETATKLKKKVFCHNDLLPGNILVNKNPMDSCNGPSVEFIDFEYGGLNLAGFDIANHFSALVEGVLIKTGVYNLDNFPSIDFQRRFLCSYFGENENIADDTFVFIRALAMLAELRWTIWAFVQKSKSSIGFDYEDYAKQRYDNGYLVLKQELMQTA
jgi:thiamine kinase-like enzyme